MNPFLSSIKHKGNLLWFGTWIVICRARNSTYLVLWLLFCVYGYKPSLNSWGCLIGNVIFSWSRNLCFRSPWHYRISKSISVVFNINSTILVLKYFVSFILTILWWKLGWNVILAWARWALDFPFFNLRMRIVKIYWDNFLLNWHFKGSTSKISISFSQVKPTHIIIRIWCRFICCLLQPSCMSISINLWNKHVLATWDVTINFLRVVSSNTRVLLLKVDVHCNWFHIVKWILFIKRKLKPCFNIYFRNLDVFFNTFWIILAWTKVNWRILNLSHR